MNQKSKNIQKYLYPVLYGAFGMLGLLLGITCWIMDRDAYPHLYPFFMMVALFCLAACGIVLVFNVIYLADMYLKIYGYLLYTIL